MKAREVEIPRLLSFEENEEEQEFYTLPVQHQIDAQFPPGCRVLLTCYSDHNKSMPNNAKPESPQRYSSRVVYEVLAGTVEEVGINLASNVRENLYKVSVANKTYPDELLVAKGWELVYGTLNPVWLIETATGDEIEAFVVGAEQVPLVEHSTAEVPTRPRSLFYSVQVATNDRKIYHGIPHDQVKYRTLPSPKVPRLNGNQDKEHPIAVATTAQSASIKSEDTTVNKSKNDACGHDTAASSHKHHSVSDAHFIRSIEGQFSYDPTDAGIEEIGILSFFETRNNAGNGGFSASDTNQHSTSNKKSQVDKSDQNLDPLSFDMDATTKSGALCSSHVKQAFLEEGQVYETNPRQKCGSMDSKDRKPSTNVTDFVLKRKREDQLPPPGNVNPTNPTTASKRPKLEYYSATLSTSNGLHSKLGLRLPGQFGRQFFMNSLRGPVCQSLCNKFGCNIRFTGQLLNVKRPNNLAVEIEGPPMPNLWKCRSAIEDALLQAAPSCLRVYLLCILEIINSRGKRLGDIIRSRNPLSDHEERNELHYMTTFKAGTCSKPREGVIGFEQACYWIADLRQRIPSVSLQVFDGNPEFPEIFCHIACSGPDFHDVAQCRKILQYWIDCEKQEQQMMSAR